MKPNSLVTWGLIALSLGSLSLGCSAKTTLGDDGLAASGGNPSDVSTELDLSPPTDTCPSTCDDPAGAIQPIEGVEQFYRNLVGRWVFCGDRGGSFPGPDDAIGVEYAAPTQDASSDDPFWRGDMYYLVHTADGLQRGQGFAYQLTYDVSPQDAAEGRPTQLNMHAEPNTGFGGAFLYSPCPRQWLISGGSASPGSSALLVPAD